MIHLPQQAGRTLPLASRIALPVTLPILLVTMVGAVLRFVGLDRNSLWTDELYAVWEGRQILPLIFDPQIHIQHPPGYRLALHGWMVFGVSEGWIRLLPAMAGVALVPVAWLIARALWPERYLAANTAAFLVATSPYLLHYSQDATTYSWTTLWLAASVLVLLHAWRSDRAAFWAVWAICAAVALYSHYFAFFPLLIEGLVVLVASLLAGREKRGRLRLRHAALALLGALALYTPWLWILLTANHGALSIYFFPLTLDTQVLRWLPTLVAGYAHQGFWQSSTAVLVAWVILLCATIFGFVRLHGSNGCAVLETALVGGWGLAALVGPYLFLRVTTPPGDVDPVRFATMCAPALLIGAAGLVGALPAPAHIVLCAMWLAVAGVQWGTEFTGGPAEDWRGVLGIVSSQAAPGDRFLAFPAFHAGAAAAYYPVPVAVQGGWFVAEGSEPAGAAYWFPLPWRWRGFFDLTAHRSVGWRQEIEARVGAAHRLWYLAGDGVNGIYSASPAAEKVLAADGWRLAGEWHRSPLVLKLYTR